MDNHLQGKLILENKLKVRSKSVQKLLINAYQSYLFNKLLAKRVLDEVKALKQQEHPFKLLMGDVMSHYPFGRIFYVEDIDSEAEKFYNQDRVPTGLLVGKKVMLSDSDARDIEKEYDDYILSNGTRRFAWISVDEIEGKYRKEEAWYELSFTLPKGSYATVLLEELLHNSLK